MFRLLLLVGLLLGHCLPGLAQELTYDALFRGDKVGYMKVSRQVSGGKVILVSETHLNVSFLLSVKLDMTFRSVFEEGKLVESLAESYRDGSLNGRSKGWRQGEAYHVDRDGQRLIVHQPIHHCVTSIHFAEPRNLGHVYSERWGEFLKMEKLPDGRYGLHLPSGEVNYYRYQNNQLTHLVVNHGWFAMEFVLR